MYIKKSARKYWKNYQDFRGDSGDIEALKKQMKRLCENCNESQLQKKTGQCITQEVPI